MVLFIACCVGKENECVTPVSFAVLETENCSCSDIMAGTKFGLGYHFVAVSEGDFITFRKVGLLECMLTRGHGLSQGIDPISHAALLHRLIRRL